MAKFLLSLHLVVAVLAVGPVAVAVSMFPRKAKAALAAGPEQATAQASVRLLHRICNIYALIGIAVPVLGIGTAQAMHVLGNAWLIASMVLTGIAAAVLMLFVLPNQQATVDAIDATENQEAETARATGMLKMLPMTAGLFNLLWVVVLVLMVIRPGSTNGA
ncbi:hypothetical protein ACFV4P_10305 [Kitasatospora sp. NPDC059795]|uniref:hypothetical protein n=1 Tax=unclassified Kitasatospora TaxID=2633591 RepID=UPI00093A5CEB|nr:hypothetical protein [Kitasatospora sp. CB01950]OKJ10297.1 hypothetical protein AMK19_15620 [Kitasatospora sp. CB01950]